MRVVAGKYRGKKLKEFSLNSTRPTLDRVKEAIFSSIQFDVLNTKTLDLFSGTGALGIEAISRGAKTTFLVDASKDAVKIIKENLKNIVEDCKVINSDYLSFLNNVKTQKFDVVLLDPPYATDYAEKAIDFILSNDMLSDNGVIVWEKAIDTKLPEYENLFVKTKKYGTVEVVYIRKH